MHFISTYVQLLVIVGVFWKVSLIVVVFVLQLIPESRWLLSRGPLQISGCVQRDGVWVWGTDWVQRQFVHDLAEGWSRQRAVLQIGGWFGEDLSGWGRRSDVKTRWNVLCWKKNEAVMWQFTDWWWRLLWLDRHLLWTQQHLLRGPLIIYSLNNTQKYFEYHRAHLAKIFKGPHSTHFQIFFF